MSEIEDINKIQIDLKGNSIETKLIDAVNCFTNLVDIWSSSNEERRRICSYAINRFTDLKESYTHFEMENAHECRNH